MLKLISGVTARYVQKRFMVVGLVVLAVAVNPSGTGGTGGRPPLTVALVEGEYADVPDVLEALIL